MIFGIGGLGHPALQYARLSGAHVIAVDVVDGKLELAHELGADHVINAAETGPAAAIQALGGADVAIFSALKAAGAFCPPGPDLRPCHPGLRAPRLVTGASAKADG